MEEIIKKMTVIITLTSLIIFGGYYGYKKLTDSSNPIQKSTQNENKFPNFNPQQTKFTTPILTCLKKWKDKEISSETKWEIEQNIITLSASANNPQQKLNSLKKLLVNHTDYEKEPKQNEWGLVYETTENYNQLVELFENWTEYEEQKNKSQEQYESRDNWYTPRKWLNDKEITWALGWISQSIPFKVQGKYKFFDATNFTFYTESLNSNGSSMKDSFPVFLSEFTGFKGELIFIPVNQPNFHWSLLIYNTQKKEFWHFDTLRSRPNHEYVKPLVEELLKHLLNNNNPNLDKHLILETDITQPNTYDCGVAVIAITERMIEAVEQGKSELGKFELGKERKKWRKKIIQE